MAACSTDSIGQWMQESVYEDNSAAALRVLSLSNTQGAVRKDLQCGCWRKGSKPAGLSVSRSLSFSPSLCLCRDRPSFPHFHPDTMRRDQGSISACCLSSYQIETKGKGIEKEREREDNRGEGHTGALNATGWGSRRKSAAAIKDTKRHLNLGQCL